LRDQIGLRLCQRQFCTPRLISPDHGLTGTCATTRNSLRRHHLGALSSTLPRLCHSLKSLSLLSDSVSAQSQRGCASAAWLLKMDHDHEFIGEPAVPITYPRTYGGNAAFHNFHNDYSHILDPNLRRRLALSEVRLPHHNSHSHENKLTGINVD
jgi:hypothetical protein